MNKWLFSVLVSLAAAVPLVFAWNSIVNTSASGRPMKGEAGHYCPSCNRLETNLDAETCSQCGRWFYPDAPSR